ncbi:MAG: hypothetical protein ACYCU7_07985 [Acidimicrobiales bacterium]
MHVDTQIAEIGQLIHITGSGWSPVGQTVQIELCGRNAQDLSTDCDQANQYSAAIRTGGIFYGALTVRPPPTPCPCVLQVTNQEGLSPVEVPMRIIGAPSAPIPAPVAPKAPVALSAKLLTPTSVSAWFGGPEAATLVLRLTNVSSIVYGSLALTVNVGRGSHPSGFAVGRPVAPLAVGATNVLRIPVTLPAFTAGHYSVRAQVITGNWKVATVVGTTTYPWGLFVVGAIALLAAVLLMWRRLRRRREGRRPPEGAGEGLGDGETAPPLRGPGEVVART